MLRDMCLLVAIRLHHPVAWAFRVGTEVVEVVDPDSGHEGREDDDEEQDDVDQGGLFAVVHVVLR